MSELVRTARRYLGVPFRHRGRNPKIGLDCVGLPLRCYADHGIVLPEVKKYNRDPHKDGLVEACIEAMGPPVKVAPVSRADLQVGDVCVQRFEIHPHHVFIVGDYDHPGELSCIHADGGQGQFSRVVEVRLSDERISLITHVFRKPI